MANPEHLAILKKGVKAWNLWRKQNGQIKPELYSADLVGARLSGADFVDANFMGAELIEADLTGARFVRANLNGAKLSEANLSRATLGEVSLRHAILFHANLSEAQLSNVTFHQTYLVRANWSRAFVGFCSFTSTDFSEAIALDTVKHYAFSSIGLDTFFKSKGKIPESFLRGCGVPDIFIEYATSLSGKAFEFYSAFISYSSKDEEFAQRLYADLQAKGIRCWLFPEDAKWGEPIFSEIDRGIKVHDKLLVICSEHSLQSEPVRREIERALQREDKEKKQVLFPIRIDDYLFHEWEHYRKADVVSKVVGDMRNWKDHDTYQKAFDKLVKNLKSDKSAV